MSNNNDNYKDTQKDKHHKNCEYCPRHSLFKGHKVIDNIVVLNCQQCNQCIKCQVSGHKIFRKSKKNSKTNMGSSVGSGRIPFPSNFYKISKLFQNSIKEQEQGRILSEAKSQKLRKAKRSGAAAWLLALAGSYPVTTRGVGERNGNLVFVFFLPGNFERLCRSLLCGYLHCY